MLRTQRCKPAEALHHAYHLSLQHPNYTFDPFPDLPADFGPSIPDDGIEGYLRVRFSDCFQAASPPWPVFHPHATSQLPRRYVLRINA